MKIIRNKYIPIGNFKCLNILGLLFVKGNEELSAKEIRHEATHTAQQYEILCASALLALFISNIYASWWYMLVAIAMPIAIYIVAWLVELVLPPYKTAYKDSPFEREAYANEDNPEYLAQRTLFAWWKYILKNRKTA